MVHTNAQSKKKVFTVSSKHFLKNIISPKMLKNTLSEHAASKLLASVHTVPLDAEDSTERLQTSVRSDSPKIR